jgi:DNA polymerase-3 subunit delta'
MSLASIETNAAVMRQLRDSVGKDRISHAYLFAGPPEIRGRVGLEFAKAILCETSRDDACDVCTICKKVEHGNHEDVLDVQKSGNTIRKDEILNIIDRLSFKPYGGRSVVIVDDADTMTIAAQNKLLKTLEEPPGRSVILLLAERKDALLPTVLSRCVQFQLRDDPHLDADTAAIGRQLVDPRQKGQPFYLRAEAIAPHISDRDLCLEVLDAAQDDLRKQLFEAVDRAQHAHVPLIRTAVARIEQARRSLQAGYNVGYTMKHLCLLIDKRETTEETVWRRL